jgi:hypothetical protein
MYCGGNQIVYEGEIHASRLSGTVVDSAGYPLSSARVQIQITASDKVLYEFTANRDGSFNILSLPPRDYWIGASTPGFNLHYWLWTVAPNGGPKTLRIQLSPGT